MAANVDIKINLQTSQAQAQIKQLTAQMNRLQAATKGVAKAFQRTNKVTSDTAAKMSIMGERTKQAALKTQIMEMRLNKMSQAGSRAKKGLGVANMALASFIGNLTSRAVSFGVTTLIKGLRGIVQAGRDFEDGLVAVGKTTGISGRQLESLGDSVTSLSRSIPVGTKNLLELATVAGQLGLKSQQDILQFTETLGKLTLATDIAGEEGAQSVAKILTITGELEENGTENIDKFGNVITRLGNNFAATESQILRVANRVAQGTAAFGIASEDVLGIATALKATGSEAEASGTAIQKTFRLIGQATQEGGQKLENFAAAAQLTTSEFVELFNADPTQLFVKLSEGLGKTVEGIEDGAKAGAVLNERLKELGLSDERLVRSLNPLITQYKTLGSAVSDARKEAASKVALDDEASKAADTLSGDVQALSNAFDEFAKNLFAVVGPALRSIVQLTADLVDGLSFLVQNGLLEAIAGAALAAAAAFGVMGVAAVAAAIKSGTLSFALAILATKITLVTGGLNLVIPAIIALGAAAGVLYKQLQDTTESSDEFNDSLKDMQATYESLNPESQKFIDSYSDIIGFTAQAKENLVEVNAALKNQTDNLVEVTEASKEYTEASKEVLFFERKKAAELAGYFNETEQAQINSIFKQITSLKEQEEFEKLILARGNERLKESVAARLGLDKASLDAKKARLEELKKIADQEAAIEIQKRIVEEQEALVGLENNKIFTDERLVQVQDFFTKREEIELQAKINSTDNELERQRLILEAQTEGQKRRIDAQVAAAEQLKNIEQDANKIIEKDNKELLQAKQKTRQADINSFRATGDLINAIAGEQTKAGFLIGKAAALAQNIINTNVAATSALAPPPLGLGPVLGQGLAAQIKTAGIISSAAIAASAITGFENGGVVGGTSFTGDRVAARVNSGEMILNRQQQSRLFSMANGQQSSDGATTVNQPIVIQLDGEQIGEATSKWVANGGQLGEVQ